MTVASRSPARIEFRTRSLASVVVDALVKAAVLDGAWREWDAPPVPATAEDLTYTLRAARNASQPNDMVVLMADQSRDDQFKALELALNKAGIAWHRASGSDKVEMPAHHRASRPSPRKGSPAP